ncbi:MAG TPA: apolipoprotein N-acyltransferase [Bryobacteraceae bacterium]|nr:apolipoprotein N-acyltransferase [Bryobacteraceae bacterium]
MKYLLAMVSAILLVLCFPRFNVVWLAPVALTPLLVAVAREPRPWRRFLLGHVAGVVYWFGVCYWIEDVLARYGGLSTALAWLAFTLFCLIKALHMGLFALLAGVLMRRWWAIPAVAALWVAIEATHGLFGFAWLALGNAGINMGLPMRLAPLTSVYGLSFVFMTMATAMALAALRRPRLQLAWLGLLPFLIFLPPLPDAQRGHDSAVLLQPDVSEDTEWTPESVDRMERNLAALSLRTAMTGGAEQPSLIVWPEVPAPLYYDADPRLRAYLADLAQAAKAYLLVGVVGHTPQGAPLNSAIAIAPDGRLVSQYSKVNLVPFGEFVPWPFDFVKRITTEAGDFAPGKQVVVTPVEGHKIAAFICYESVFPNFVRRFVVHGAEVLFNLSNDGYFGKSAARMQHLEIVRMRAAENRRWILRSTNDGITATIDPAGRLRGSLPGFVRAASRTGFTYIQSQTFYTRFGDWFPILCGAVATVLLLATSLARAGESHN